MTEPTKTRTGYKLEVLAKDGWTVVRESNSKATCMKALGRLAEPEAIAEYEGICAARVVTTAGKIVARLPETGAFTTVTLSNEQCRELAAERGEEWTPDEEAEADAREKAIAAAKESTTSIDTVKAEDGKRRNVIGGIKRRPGTDARGFMVAVGDEVRVGKTGDPLTVTAVAADEVTLSDGQAVGARKVTVLSRKDGEPILPTDVEGTILVPGDRCRSPWSGRTGTIEAVKPDGSGMVWMRHDHNKARVDHPAPSLVKIGHVDLAATA